MAEPITAAELAEALRKFTDSYDAVCASYDGYDLDTMSDCESREELAAENARELLVRYDAQQTDASKPALSDVEQAALNAVAAHEATLATSHRTVRGIEAREVRDIAICELREALRKRGAL